MSFAFVRYQRGLRTKKTVNEEAKLFKGSSSQNAQGVEAEACHFIIKEVQGACSRRRCFRERGLALHYRIKHGEVLCFQGGAGRILFPRRRLGCYQGRCMEESRGGCSGIMFRRSAQKGFFPGNKFGAHPTCLRLRGRDSGRRRSEEAPNLIIE